MSVTDAVCTREIRRTRLVAAVISEQDPSELELRQRRQLLYMTPEYRIVKDGGGPSSAELQPGSKTAVENAVRREGTTLDALFDHFHSRPNGIDIAHGDYASYQRIAVARSHGDSMRAARKQRLPSDASFRDELQRPRHRTQSHTKSLSGRAAASSSVNSYFFRGSRNSIQTPCVSRESTNRLR